MCKCGCNSCETKSTALVLKESKFVHTPISEGLKYHIDNQIPLSENIYRIGSKEYMKLYTEARSLYSRGKLDVNEADKYFLTETHVGGFGMFEGKRVPLDIPMISEQMDLEDEIANEEFGMDYDQLGPNEKEWVRDEIDNMSMNENKEYYVTVNRGHGDGKRLVTSAESDYEEPRVFSKEEAEEYVKRVKNSGATPGRIASYWVSDRDMNRIDENEDKLSKIKQELEALRPGISWIDDIRISSYDGSLQVELDYTLYPNEIKQLAQIAAKYGMELKYMTGKNASLVKNKLNENIDTGDFLNKNRDQIELDFGPRTFRMLQMQLMKDDEAFVRDWLVANGYMEEEKLPFEENLKKVIKEKLCKKGEAYRKRRMAAGEKSSAYLSGRAVKVCKGQMSGKKKKKANENTAPNHDGKAAPYGSGYKVLDIDKIAESLKDWFEKENWVRINTSGNISGDCGTMKKGKATTRCLPKKKAQAMTKAERKATVAKKVRGSKKGKQFVSVKEAMVDYDFSKEELIRVIKQLKRGASTEVGMIKAFEKALGRELTDDEIRGFKLDEAEAKLSTIHKAAKKGNYPATIVVIEKNKVIYQELVKTPQAVPAVFNILQKKYPNAKISIESKTGEVLFEAEFRGKEVSLNKPKRGGSKAYYVYVRDPKTKKIKKVSFGSGGLRAKIKNKDARNAFAKRHNCDKKKDRTKAGYWSCNLPRYAKQLGLGANMNTFW